MAADDYKVEYHLTPNGWVPGTNWYFNRQQGDTKPRPNDTVETWLHHATQSSAYAKEEYVTWKKTWTNPDIDKEVIAGLHKKYPKSSIK